jgi:hypothetical protein
VPWHTSLRDLLERQFDSLGLERNFETGIIDTAVGVESLADYPDYHTGPEDDLGPEYEQGVPKDPHRPHERGGIVALHYLKMRGPGSRQLVDGDERRGRYYVVCAQCGRVVITFERSAGSVTSALAQVIHQVRFNCAWPSEPLSSAFEYKTVWWAAVDSNQTFSAVPST